MELILFVLGLLPDSLLYFTLAYSVTVHFAPKGRKCGVLRAEIVFLFYDRDEVKVIRTFEGYANPFWQKSDHNKIFPILHITVKHE